MNLQPITALSPLDGRYESKVSALREHFSEFGLIRNRVKVEVEWLKALAAAPELADLASDLQSQGRQAFVQIDRAQASRLGVTVAGIDTALYNAFGQRLISTIFTQSNQYRVVLEVAPQFKLGPEALNSIYVTSSAGKPVALSSVARIEERPMPLAVNHVGQLPAATLSFNTAPGASLGAAVQAMPPAPVAVAAAATDEDLLDDILF